jgi:hypothetical protein
MYKLPDAPQSLGGILDDGFKLFAASWKALLPLSVAAMLITIAPQFMITGLDNIRPGEMPGFGALGTGFFVTIVISTILSIFAYAAIIAGIHQAAMSEPVTTGEAFRRGLSSIPSYLGVGLIWILFTAALFAPLFVPGFPRGAWGLVCVLLFSYLVVALYPAGLLPVVEGLGPVATLMRAWQLVKGSWWRTAMILAVMGLIFIALMFVVSMVLGIVAAPLAVGSGGRMSPIVMNAVFAVLLAPVVPLLYCLMYAVYTDLRLRKGGGDLLSRAAAAGT